ncbi:MAG: LytTR family transcriptional regulator DNA-binding domain-containing protein [Acidobacteriota bacterium]|nr:LytTR family transcriptional regulator DNA-binding domain-containing protein [Acidobacteriota bacterium]
MGQHDNEKINKMAKELLFSLGVGVVVIDLENQITFMNPFAEKMLARIRNRAVGMNVLECHLPKNQKIVKQLITKTLGSEDQLLPLVKIIDGPATILSVRLNPLLDSEDLRAGVVMVINDLTSEVMLSEKESSQAYLFKLPVFVKGKIIFIDVDEIIYLQSVKNYTTVHLYDKEHLTNLPLYELENRFKQKMFCRVHRSFMVNLSKVEELSSVKKGRYHVRVADKNKTIIPVSRKGAKTLKEILRF